MKRGGILTTAPSRNDSLRKLREVLVDIREESTNLLQNREFNDQKLASG